MVIGLTVGAARVHADTSLAKARELYASASYAEALAALDALLTESAPAEREAIALYRVLCLVALGRAADAEVAIERLVSEHPLYRPPSDELPPRMRTAVTEARKRMLPAVIQQRYATAKAAFDKKEFQPAAAGFKWVLDAVADPDIMYAASRPPLSDLSTLAAGFRDLSEKALAPPPPPPASVAVAPAAPVRDYRRVYTPGDDGVTPPVTIRQTLPRFPSRLTGARLGVLEVVVDATGTVESARMVDPVHPQYDELAVSAAKKWEYQPARVDGVPVRFLKRVQINVTQ